MTGRPLGILYYQEQWTALCRALQFRPCGDARHMKLEDGRLMFAIKSIVGQHIDVMIGTPEEALRKAYEGKALLPPYEEEHVAAYESALQIRLPSLLRVYLTEISRYFCSDGELQLVQLDPSVDVGANPIDADHLPDMAGVNIWGGTLKLGTRRGGGGNYVVIKGKRPGLVLHFSHLQQLSLGDLFCLLTGSQQQS